LISPEKQLIYILINKPRNVITTTADEHQRKTVLDLIKDEAEERLFPVGRLDRNTTGLLLITNDGDLAKKLSHPSHEVRKEYLVTLDLEVPEKDLEKIRKGLILEDGPVPVNAVAYRDEMKKQEVEIALHIGRNRIVRRIFEHLGYTVKALERTYYAGLTLKNLPRGKYRHLTPREVIMLKHFT
jgi:23S rRNA pseudouridine2605 synthase